VLELCLCKACPFASCEGKGFMDGKKERGNAMFDGCRGFAFYVGKVHNAMLVGLG
jgi:hypothetical protein